MISRRTLLRSALLAASTRRLAAAADRQAAFEQTVAGLEQKHGGRLGVAVLGTAGTATLAHRGGERFAMCSTHKLLSAAFVLARVDRREEDLARRITYKNETLVAYSPTTGKHVEDGMTVAELCEAAITVSDNTADNLLLDSFGGPAAPTGWLRSIGDSVTRLDRREPELNENTPGDPRDTTTPLALIDTMHRIVLGPVLSDQSRKQLTMWLIANTTGDKRLRAGIPGGWRIGDKTGTGERNATNDVAVLWPPDRAPILVAAFYTNSPASLDDREAVLAEVGRLAATG